MGVTWTKETIDNAGYSTDSINSASLTVDSIKIDGRNIGHTDDTNLLTLANGAFTVDGTLTVGSSGSGHDVRFYGATASNYLEYDASSNQLDIRSTGLGAQLTLYTTESSESHGPVINMIRDVAGADNDSIGSISFMGEDEGSNQLTYARVYSQILDATDGDEKGSLHLKVITDKGSSANALMTGIWLKGSSTDSEITTNMPNGPVIIGKDSENRGSLTLFDGGGSNTPGYIKFYQPNGTPKYVWVDDSGDLMIHNSIPTDSGGTVVGSQS